jgi:chaperonin GroES
MSNVNLKMLDDGVLIRSLIEEKKGGIMIPSSAEKKPTKGEVIAIGEGSRNNANGERIALTVTTGDKVFYRQWAGTEIEHNEEKLIVMKESDILAIIR